MEDIRIKLNIDQIRKHIFNFIYKNYYILWAISISAGIYFSNFNQCCFPGIGHKMLIIAILFILILLLLIGLLIRNIKNNVILKRLLLAAIVFSCFVAAVSGLFLNLNYKAKNDLSILPVIYKSQKDSGLLTRGRVISHIKQGKYGSVSFLLEINELTKDGAVLDNISEAAGVIVKSADDILIARDDVITFNCTIRQSDSQENKYYLYTYADCIKVIKPVSLADKIYKIRQKFYLCISKVFFKSLKYNNAAFCEAVVLGNSNLLGNSYKDDFRKSGIYHLLAISGLHISFFILIFSNSLNYLIKAGKSGRFTKTGISRSDFNNPGRLSVYCYNFLIIAVLFMYNFIIGQRASVLRATLMVVLVFLAKGWKREYAKGYILSMIFIIMLVIDTRYFYQSGFWLSFVSVSAIIYVNEIISGVVKLIRLKLKGIFYSSRIIDMRTGMTALIPATDHKKSSVPGFFNIGAYIRGSLITVLSVNILIFPILAYTFKEIPVFSLPVNIIAVPAFYMILLVLITGSIAALFCPQAGAFIMKPADVFIPVLFKIARIYKGIEKTFGLSSIKISNFSSLHIFLYYLSLLFILIIINNIVLKRYNLKSG